MEKHQIINTSARYFERKIVTKKLHMKSGAETQRGKWQN